MAYQRPLAEDGNASTSARCWGENANPMSHGSSGIRKGSGGRWSSFIMGAVWQFARHVARHDCPARDVMLWRNLEWWRGQQALSPRVTRNGQTLPPVQRND